MKFDVKNNVLEESCDCIAIGIFKDKWISESINQLDKVSNGYISDLLNQGDLCSEIGQSLLLYKIPNILCNKILLVGCGNKKDLEINKYRKIIKNMTNELKKFKFSDVICCLTELNVYNTDFYWKLRINIESIEEILYTFDKFKSEKYVLNKITRKITFIVPSIEGNSVRIKQAIKHSIAISDSIKSAKDLSNLPPNICDPTYISTQAYQLSKNYHDLSSFSVINKEDMKRIGMNAYLSVSNGSKRDPIISIIKYNGANNSKIKPIILIGKGVTFDTGGISIKPSKNMEEMKYDMCGASSVYGAMMVAMKLNLKLNIIGILACCENMIDGKSYRPGDVLTTLSGKTVEILNTDAEGRLILCDVLTYVKRFNPELVIDIATLTGACIVSLGYHLTGLISNSDNLAFNIIEAGKQTNDQVWQFPIMEEFKEQLTSNIADIRSTGEGPGGMITAGCFLSKFVEDYDWAHLDIAGTAWSHGRFKSATGRPISMISQFLINYQSKIHNEDN